MTFDLLAPVLIISWGLDVSDRVSEDIENEIDVFVELCKIFISKSFVNVAATELEQECEENDPGSVEQHEIFDVKQYSAHKLNQRSEIFVNSQEEHALQRGCKQQNGVH